MNDSLEAAIVRIQGSNPGVFGAGFLVGERQVLTASTVVWTALGGSAEPPEAPSEKIILHFPFVAPEVELTARVVLWKPDRPAGANVIAGLELETDLPAGARLVNLLTPDDFWGLSFRTFGYPRGQPEGSWETGSLRGRQANGWVQVEALSGWSGTFSGAPAWNEAEGGVVGMLMPFGKEAGLVPSQVLIEAWPILQASAEQVRKTPRETKPPSGPAPIVPPVMVEQDKQEQGAESALQGVLAIEDENERAQALTELIESLSDYTDDTVISSLLGRVRRIPQESLRAKALTLLAPRLSEPLLAEALTATRKINSESSRLEVLLGLAPHFPAPLLPRVLGEVRRLSDPPTLAQAIKGLARYLNKPLLDEAVALTEAINSPVHRERTRAQIATFLPEDERLALLERTAHNARGISEAEARAQVLVTVAESMPNSPPQDLLEDAVQAAQSIEQDDLRAKTLSRLAQKFAEPRQGELLHQALAAARAIESEKTRRQLLEGMASLLSDELREQVLAEANAIPDEPTPSPTPEKSVASRPQPLKIAIRALADTPSEIDLLDFSDYADALADFIRNEKTEKPLTIGIDGAWGTGKTTLMDMVQGRLTGKQGQGAENVSFPTVSFNAWKYDKEESLWAALALAILSQIRPRMLRRERAKFWVQLNWKRLDKGKLLRASLKPLIPVICIGLGVVAILAIFAVTKLWQYAEAVGVLAVVSALYSAFKQVSERLKGAFDLDIGRYIREPNYRERVGFLAEFEDDFQSIVNIVTKNGKWPLVVFIDDLDRCAPPKPVEIIEAINLLLDAKHCVFVIGMDARAVAASIEGKYKNLKNQIDDSDEPGGLSLGQRFLRKIIQVSFHIPRPEAATLSSFIDASLGVKEPKPVDTSPTPEVARAAELIKAEQRAGKSLKAASQEVQMQQSGLSQRTVEEARKAVFAESFDESEVVRRAVHDAASFLGSNPRRIKRFINTFRLQAYIANRRNLFESGTISLEVLAKWVILATRWPDILEVLANDQGFVDSLKKAQDQHDRLANSPANKDLQASVEMALRDGRIRRFIGARDLMNVLQEVTKSEAEVWSQYLHLTQVTLPTSEAGSATK